MRRLGDYRLWLGHAGDLRDPRAIFAADIRAVVDLAINEPPAALPRELIYCRFPLLDGAGNPDWLLRLAVDTVAALLRERTPTLVACSAGMSRSLAIAAAALAVSQGLSPFEALTHVAGIGPADLSPSLWAEVQGVLGQDQDKT
jgi:hypothetical protein